MKRVDEIICGTRQGYLLHVKRGEETDEACRTAHNEYMQHYRTNVETKESKEGKRLLMKARSKALTRLSREFPDEFAHLLDIELKAVGLPPRGIIHK